MTERDERPRPIDGVLRGFQIGHASRLRRSGSLRSITGSVAPCSTSTQRFPRSAQRPAATALLVDFDGSLSPIVDHPDDARAACPARSRVLARLVAAFGRVGVVSGRPVEFLAEHVPVAGLALRRSVRPRVDRSTACVAVDPRVAAATSTRSRPRPRTTPRRGCPASRRAQGGRQRSRSTGAPRPNRADEVLGGRRRARRRATGSTRRAEAARRSSCGRRSPVDKGTAVDALDRRLRRRRVRGRRHRRPPRVRRARRRGRTTARSRRAVRIGVTSAETPAELARHGRRRRRRARAASSSCSSVARASECGDLSARARGARRATIAGVRAVDELAQPRRDAWRARRAASRARRRARPPSARCRTGGPRARRRAARRTRRPRVRGTATPSRRLSSGPSFATRLRPSLIGFTKQHVVALHAGDGPGEVVARRRARSAASRVSPSGR